MITKFVAVCPLDAHYVRLPFEIQSEVPLNTMALPQEVAEALARSIFDADVAIHCWAEHA